MSCSKGIFPWSTAKSVWPTTKPEFTQLGAENPLRALALLVRGLSQGLVAEPATLYWAIGLPVSLVGALILAYHLMSKSVVRLGVITSVAAPPSTSIQ